MRYFMAAAITINLLAFLLYSYDKAVAKWEKRRLPENSLLLVSLLGGSLGAMIAMFLLHHKIARPKFRYGVFCMFVLHLLLLAWWQGWIFR